MAAHIWRSMSSYLASSSPGAPHSNDQTMRPHPPSPAPAPPPSSPSSAGAATAAASSVGYATCALVFTGIQAARRDFEEAMERERARRAADVGASEEAARRRAEDLAAQALRTLKADLAAGFREREEVLEARVVAREEALETRLARLEAEAEAEARRRRAGSDRDAGDGPGMTVQQQQHPGGGGSGEEKATAAQLADLSVRLEALQARVEASARDCRQYTDRELGGALRRGGPDADRRWEDTQGQEQRLASLEAAMAETADRNHDSVVLLSRDCAGLEVVIAENSRRYSHDMELLRRDCASLEAVVVDNDRRHVGNVEQLRRDCGRAGRRCAATEERIASLQRRLDEHVARLLQPQDQQRQQEPRGAPSRPESVRSSSPAIYQSPESTCADVAPASPPPSQTAQELPTPETSGACSDDRPKTKPARARRPRNRSALTKELKSLSTGDKGRGGLPSRDLGHCTIPELFFTFDRRYRHQKPSPEHRFVREFLRSVHELLAEHDRTRLEAGFLDSQRGVFQRRQAGESLWCGISAKWHDVRFCMWSFQEVRDVLIPDRP
ncbi:hypothetical protein GGTG_01490 [Gaeumannomyces tritici R3-111a-1]|uniref:Uncharacterized protein n=1 Tax=Gaeumannomyces tritici (strain R3-111a-1) TaxID=644352 RepID=J3NJR0_GAET3|nr:hypothetical protein GGTG_01490 [Gaeumannomyces tritici R3-111a-1]EJT81512.1 hypothetical protein GGTG_01490 [Gaeumannomyces tritici R3-111a-1]